MQLKRQSVEAWQNEKYYSKVNSALPFLLPLSVFSNELGSYLL